MILNKNIAIIISAILLLLALIKGWPYGFFTLLRLVVFGTTAYLSYLAYKSEKQAWTWLFGFVAIVFNPLIPLHLGRNIWVVVDLSVAIFLIISIFAFKLPKELRMAGKEMGMPVESNQWYFATDGETKEGPVSKETLLSLKSSGRVSDDTLIWSSGMQEWKPLSDVLVVLPPPLPKEALQQESKLPPTESIRSETGLPETEQSPNITSSDESIPQQSVEEPNKSDVESGAQWAKWLGIAKMVTGVFLLSIMASGGVPIGDFTGIDAVFQISIGAVSLSLGLKLLNPDKRKSTQFLTLIIIYGVAIALHVIEWAHRVAVGEPTPRQIIPILTAWALWKFIKGRREMKKIEEIRVT